MDSNDVIVFHQMMAENVILADNKESHMTLPILLDAQADLDATPKQGGSERGRLAKKNRQRTTDHVLLFNDYFSRTLANNVVISVDALG